MPSSEVIIMSLMAITGTLGQGKSLSMVFFGAINWLQHGQKVFSNIHVVYENPYTDEQMADLGITKHPIYNDEKSRRYKAVMVEDPEDIETIREGVFLGDELWAWMDSRTSGKKSNRIGSKILLASRKRKYHIFYTCQDLSQMEKRVRIITDFEAVPMLLRNKTVCIVDVFQLKYGKRVRFVRRYKFYTAPIFKMYDTNEEIDIKEFG